MEGSEEYFHAGDIIYLDVSEFTEWENDDAVMYVNFTNASKKENSGQDIEISTAEQTKYSPRMLDRKAAPYKYVYIVTKEDEGSEELRFWRGKATTLWNYSVVLSQNLIDNLPDNNKVGIVKFLNSTSVLTSSLTSDKEKAKSFLTTSYF